VPCPPGHAATPRGFPEPWTPAIKLIVLSGLRPALGGTFPDWADLSTGTYSWSLLDDYL